MQPNSTKKMKAAHRGIITEILKHTKCKAGILKKEKARKKKEKKRKKSQKEKKKFQFYHGQKISVWRKSQWNEKFNFKENKISKALYEETSQKSTSSTIKK